MGDRVILEKPATLIFGCNSSPISLDVRVCKSDKMRESNLLKGCKPSENHTKRSNTWCLAFQKMMDSVMDIDKLNLSNLVGWSRLCCSTLLILWIIRKMNKSNCDKTSGLIRPYLASVATNVKMLKCLCFLQIS